MSFNYFFHHNLLPVGFNNLFSNNYNFNIIALNHIHALELDCHLHHIDGDHLQSIGEKAQKLFATASRWVNWRAFVEKFSAESSPESFQ